MKIANVSRRGFLRQSFGAGAFILGARVLPTVSYTHLDVYKRQESAWPSKTTST